MPAKKITREDILDSALELAESRGWESLRMFEIAAARGITLAKLSGFFREKEEIADAWFDRADRSMLQASTAADFAGLSPQVKFARLILAWLEVLGAHKRVTREMVLGKLEPGHIHVLLPAMLRVSRTVQWVREAAGRRQIFLLRAMEEVALSGIFLSTFVFWLQDSSDDLERSERFLRLLLRRGNCVFECGTAPREEYAATGTGGDGDRPGGY